MTKLICGYLGLSDPYPFQYLTGYAGKRIKCTATAALALTEGGSPTHPHVVINFDLDYSTGRTIPKHLGSNDGNVEKRHKSHSRGPTSVTSGDNNPLSIHFSLIWIDLSYWEAYVRRFPENTVLLSDVLLDWAEVERYSTADGRLMMIGSTPGTLQGEATEGHDVTIALNSFDTNSGYSTFYQSGSSGSYYRVPGSHSHTSGAPAKSTAESTMPARIRTRILKTLSLTTKALQGIICFFDDTPSANWSIMTGWDGRFVESYNSDATAIGSSVHGHEEISGTSGGPSSTTGRKVYGDTEANLAYNNHVHPWICDLEESNHEPEYVYLVPAKLLTTLTTIGSEAAPQLIGPLW